MARRKNVQPSVARRTWHLSASPLHVSSCPTHVVVVVLSLLALQLFPDIMSMFVLENKKKETVEDTEAAAKKQKAKAVTFLTAERSKKLGIGLSKFNKLGFKAVIHAVQHMDDEVLGGLEGIETLVLNVPEPGEVRGCSQHRVDAAARA